MNGQSTNLNFDISLDKENDPLASKTSNGKSQTTTAGREAAFDDRHQQIPGNRAMGCCGCLQVEYWQPYFVMTTADLLHRVKCSVTPAFTG